MNTFIHIRSSRFPILPEEKEELVNDGMYGKALALYLQHTLQERGHEVPFICCEDWGWWVEVRGAPFAVGVCIYSGPIDHDPMDYACAVGVSAPKQWSWSKFRFVDASPWIQTLQNNLLAIFHADQDVQTVAISDEFPDWNPPLQAGSEPGIQPGSPEGGVEASAPDPC